MGNKLDYLVRSPNESPHIASVVRAWRRSKDSFNRMEKSYIRSLNSNINNNGLINSFCGDTITPHSIYFHESIEPGVADLVSYFVKERMITYTSCEGHKPYGDTEGCERHVGILKEETIEGIRPSDIDIAKYSQSINIYNGHCHHNQAKLYSSHVLCTDSNYLYSTFELYLRKRCKSSWTEYFSEIDARNTEFLCLLER